MTNPLRKRAPASSARNRARQYNRLVVKTTQDLLLAMEHAGISKSELARRLNKHKSYVSKLLSGDTNMTLRTLSDVAFQIGKVPNVELCDLREDARLSAHNVRLFIAPSASDAGDDADPDPATRPPGNAGQVRYG